MIARLRRSLGAGILLRAALNVVLLIAIALAASGVRIPRSVTQVVMQSAESRLQDVARRIALDLERTPAADADALLDRYGAEYRTRFVLVRNDGSRIAGVALPIPVEVQRALTGPPPDRLPWRGDEGRPPRFRPPGPPDRLGSPGPASGPRMPQTPAHLVRTASEPRNWIVLRTPIRFAGAIEIVPGSLLVVPLGFFGDPLLFPARGLLWVIAGLIVTVLCWWPLLRRLTTSLERMAHATSEIAHGRFETRIGVKRTDEIGRLASSIEQMSGRLGALVSGQKRFLGDTAHELRSPIGRMQVALEILHNRVDEGERSYLIDLKDDVEELRYLTDALLQFARAEHTDRAAVPVDVAVWPIISRVIDRDGEGASITTSVDPAIVVKADSALLDRAVSNVIRNAITHAGKAGPIHVAAISGGDRIVISVADHGPGVAAESLTRLFEPFFREDEARNRRTGGVGLGLAIVRSAIEACGGSVSCSNREPHGLEVRMELRRA